MVMTIFKTQNLKKFWAGFSFSFGFDVSRKNGFGSSLGFQKIWLSRCQFQFGFEKFSSNPGFQV